MHANVHAGTGAGTGLPARVCPHGPAGSFDDHTCYAATPFAVDGSKELQYFYSGGNGPHNGVQTPGGVHVRDDAMALARGSADARDPAGMSCLKRFRGRAMWGARLSFFVDDAGVADTASSAAFLGVGVAAPNPRDPTSAEKRLCFGALDAKRPGAGAAAGLAGVSSAAALRSPRGLPPARRCKPSSATAAPSRCSTWASLTFSRGLRAGSARRRPARWTWYSTR